ncbi:MAG: hypothetical protein JWM68_610 [Verrucomicrobiales bacterium]|nr:hypothetical protein [Verrucomicrobiales bacterium]
MKSKNTFKKVLHKVAHHYNESLAYKALTGIILAAAMAAYGCVKHGFPITEPAGAQPTKQSLDPESLRDFEKGKDHIVRHGDYKSALAQIKKRLRTLGLRKPAENFLDFVDNCPCFAPLKTELAEARVHLDEILAQ